MASGSNALIVEVVGDTSKLTASLTKAEKDLKGFADSAARSGKLGPKSQQVVDDIEAARKARKADAEAAAEQRARMDEVTAAQDANAASMRRFAVGAAAAGLVVNRVGANLNELGGNAGKLGGALSDLTSGNIVGFVKGMQSINATDPAKLGADLLKYGDAAKATEFANKAAAAGWDAMSKAARSAALEIANVKSGLDAYNLSLAETIHDSTSPGAIFNADQRTLRGDPGPMLPGGRMRPGVSQGQRNTFFDNALARQLDRAQDNVAKLREIAAEIQKEINARNDVTRKATLSDRLAEVNRNIDRIQLAAANEAARLAKQRADAEERRLAELKRIAAARQQARDDLALGLQTPGAPNLRQQLAQLTGRTDIGSISSRLGSALDGARRILNRKSKDINEETRSNIASLFETIRTELNKGATGGPLTKTTQLSERILAGLGLSAADERILRARISHFNSAGTALAGTGAGSNANLTTNVVVDGKVVATTSAKYNRRTNTYNTRPRNGPSAGGYVGA